jgi:pyrroloquinoline quinone (PQQ) biosynthesis protein C
MCVQDEIDVILREANYHNNPYFVHLRDGLFDKEDFLETQIQFFYAVIFFSRPMAALAAKIPTPELRVEIVRNVWEEHGEGDPTRVHGSTFLALLDRLGKLKSDDVDRRVLWPEVRIFNTTLVGACVLDEYLIGVGMMGIIERMFCDISSWIGRGIVDRGWLTKKQMIHYNLHEKVDVKHSEDFFAILKPVWEKDVPSRYYIDQGLRLGATVFNGLYEGLYRGRKRRWMRALTGPHTRDAG